MYSTRPAGCNKRRDPGAWSLQQTHKKKSRSYSIRGHPSPLELLYWPVEHPARRQSVVAMCALTTVEPCGSAFPGTVRRWLRQKHNFRPRDIRRHGARRWKREAAVGCRRSACCPFTHTNCRASLHRPFMDGHGHGSWPMIDTTDTRRGRGVGRSERLEVEGRPRGEQDGGRRAPEESRRTSYICTLPLPKRAWAGSSARACTTRRLGGDILPSRGPDAW